jgi:hypothetical protein
MRVARRIRPSRVGCGATVDRRRLHAASITSETPPASVPVPAPTRSPLSLIIHADGQISNFSQFGTSGNNLEQPRHEALPALAGASTRGR